MLPTELVSVIAVFAPVFSRSAWPQVKVLITGATLAPGQWTIIAVLQIMGHHAASYVQTSHHILNRAGWSPLATSQRLLRLLVAVFIPRKAFTAIPCAPPGRIL
jgi:hypothetical protein